MTRKNYKKIDVNYIGYVTFKEIANCNNINRVNPLYLMIDHFEEKSGNKYLVLDDIDENKEVSKKYKEVWEDVKKEIETINGGIKTEYGKDLEKIKFKSNDNLPLDRPVKLLLLTIIIKSVFSVVGKSYSQLFLDDALYEL